jgi:hypothetical protein
MQSLSSAVADVVVVGVKLVDLETEAIPKGLKTASRMPKVIW